MKTRMLFINFILLTINGIAQPLNFPNGVYLSLEQLRNQTPAFDIDLTVIQRTSEDIVMFGGNDIKLKPKNDSLKLKFIKKKIFAYVKNDSIYLNCIHYKLQMWYSLCLTNGSFLVFKTPVMNDDTFGFVASGGGAMGVVIAGAFAADKRFLNVLSLRTGNVRRLRKVYLIERLKEDQNLLDQFNLEKDQKSDSILIKYIDLLRASLKTA